MYVSGLQVMAVLPYSLSERNAEMFSSVIIGVNALANMVPSLVGNQIVSSRLGSSSGSVVSGEAGCVSQYSVGVMAWVSAPSNCWASASNHDSRLVW